MGGLIGNREVVGPLTEALEVHPDPSWVLDKTRVDVTDQEAGMEYPHHPGLAPQVETVANRLV